MSQLLTERTRTQLYTNFGSLMSGLASVRAFGAGDFFEAKNARLSDVSSGPAYYTMEGALFLRVGLLWLSVRPAQLGSSGERPQTAY